MSSIYIKVTLNHSKAISNSNISSREAFWRPIRQSERIELNVSQIENKFIESLGDRLKEYLIQDVSKAIRNIEQGAWDDYFEKLSFRFEKRMEKFHPEERFVFGDFYANGIEARVKLIQELPEYRSLLKKRLLANTVVFSPKIENYSSLILSILVPQAEKLGQFFDSDFEAFQIFLEQYLPLAFKKSITYSSDPQIEDFFNQLNYQFDFPCDKFPDLSLSGSDEDEIQTSESSPPQTFSGNRASHKMDKGNLIWAISNFSLLFPVILTLFVLYYTVQGFQNQSTDCGTF